MNTGQCVYHCNIARHGRPQRFYTKYKRHKWCPMVIRFLRRAFFSLFPLHVVVVFFCLFFSLHFIITIINSDWWIPPAVNLPIFSFFFSLHFDSTISMLYRSCITSCLPFTHSRFGSWVKIITHFQWFPLQLHSMVAIRCGIWRKNSTTPIWMIRCALCVVFYKYQV